MPAQADIGEGAYGEGDRQLWVVSNWRVLVGRHEATSVVTICEPALAAATAIPAGRRRRACRRHLALHPHAGWRGCPARGGLRGPPATALTWRLNRAFTFDASGRGKSNEAMRYAVVTAVAQSTSYLVFAVLVSGVLASLPQAAILVGAACGAMVSYNGHRLFAFAPVKACADLPRC